MSKGLFKPATQEQIRNRPRPDPTDVITFVEYAFEDMQTNLDKMVRQSIWDNFAVPIDFDLGLPETCTEAKLKMRFDQASKRLDIDIYLKPVPATDFITINVVEGEV